METNQKQKIAMEVSVITIAINLLLSLFKIIAGITANSGAMISDAVHSASDVFSTIVVMIGVKISGKSSDKNHPYGHERFECVAAILLAAILFAVGAGIGYLGIEKIIQGNYDTLSSPGMLALSAAVISIIVKEAMYWYTRAAAKKINSGALMADAWHHRSDAFSSVGSFAGILGARIGSPIFDPIASVVICIFIVKAAFDIFTDAIGKMTDTACDEETSEGMRELILKQEGVLGIDQLKTRLFGDKIYVDIEIKADCNLTLSQSHSIAQQVHDAIEEQFKDVKHCMVHVNPAEPEQGSVKE